MLTALVPLGATHDVSIVLAYDGDNVTATILAKPKKDDKSVTPIQFEGPVAEVELEINDKLAELVNEVVKSSSNIADLKQQLKDAEAEATKKVADKKAPAKKPTPPPAPAKKGEKPKAPAKKPADKGDDAKTNEKPGSAQSAVELLEDI